MKRCHSRLPNRIQSGSPRLPQAHFQGLCVTTHEALGFAQANKGDAGIRIVNLIIRSASRAIHCKRDHDEGVGGEAASKCPI